MNKKQIMFLDANHELPEGNVKSHTADDEVLIK